MPGRIAKDDRIGSGGSEGAFVAAAYAQDEGLWGVYDSALKGAKYIDLTHVIAPNIPVRYGFGPSKVHADPARRADIEGYVKKGEAYSYEKHGFEATHYDLLTDRLRFARDDPAQRKGPRCGPLTSS